MVAIMAKHDPFPVCEERFRAAKRWLCLDIPLMDYQEALDLQHALVEARVSGLIERNLILLLEHPPVFTLGRRGGLGHLLVDESLLESEGIKVFHAERGGDITYHGPGQLVAYPVVDLGKTGLGVVELVGALEEVMIRVAGECGIQAGRNPGKRGVWVGKKKLGSVGIAIRHQVSFHGMALNVNNSMKPFSWINPCGLVGVEMVSMEQLLGRSVVMEEARAAVRRHVGNLFGVELEEISLERIYTIPGLYPPSQQGRETL